MQIAAEQIQKQKKVDSLRQTSEGGSSSTDPTSRDESHPPRLRNSILISSFPSHLTKSSAYDTPSRCSSKHISTSIALLSHLAQLRAHRLLHQVREHLHGALLDDRMIVLELRHDRAFLVDEEKNSKTDGQTDSRLRSILYNLNIPPWTRTTWTRSVLGTVSNLLSIGLRWAKQIWHVTLHPFCTNAV